MVWAVCTSSRPKASVSLQLMLGPSCSHHSGEKPKLFKVSYDSVLPHPQPSAFRVIWAPGLGIQWLPTEASPALKPSAAGQPGTHLSGQSSSHTELVLPLGVGLSCLAVTSQLCPLNEQPVLYPSSCPKPNLRSLTLTLVLTETSPLWAWVLVCCPSRPRTM